MKTPSSNTALYPGVVIFILIWSFLGRVEPVFAASRTAPLPVRPEHARPAVVQWRDGSMQTGTAFSAHGSKSTTGGFLANGDLDGDSVQELVIGAGLGGEPEVRIVQHDGTVKTSFFAYPKTFRGGVRVAVADLDGDSRAEIITAPGPGMAAIIHVYDASGREKMSTLTAYTPSFVGGAHVAAGDLDGDGKAEIVTSPGPGGGPHVRIWNNTMQNIGKDFFPYDMSMTDGVTVSLVRSPQGLHIMTGVESWSMPLVKRYALFPEVMAVAEFLAFASSSRSGVVTSAFDIDNDGYDEIAVVGNGGTAPVLRYFDVYGTFISEHRILDEAYRGSFSMVQAKDAASAAPKIAIMPNAPVITGPWDAERKIEVSLKEQRLYAYEHGRIAKSFLVSTGVRRHPTPVGKTSVLKKVPIMDYRWNYGPGHPDNYDLKNVRYNLKIFPNIFIHTAYWHNNFGYRMSHGCVNASLEDAKWTYGWADVGTQVEVKA